MRRPFLVNGIFGPKTRARVVQFQPLHGLKPDAIVGPLTHQALYTFVDYSHHPLTENRDGKQLLARANLRAVGDNPSQAVPLRLPPFPGSN